MSSPYELKESPYSSHSQILALFPPQGNGARVLDLGCGNAYLGGQLAARGYRVTGVERAGGFQADRIPAGVQMITADLEQPLTLDGAFDYVLCADILEHLREPERLLRGIPRWLTPGGRLIASLPNSGHLYFRLTVLAGRFPQEEKGLFDRTHVRFYMWDGWQALMAGAGFEMGEVRVSGVPFVLVCGDRWFVPALEWLSHRVAMVWRKLFAYQFIISCYHRSSVRGA